MRFVDIAAYSQNERRRQYQLRLRNTAAPAITGTAAAGNTLSVSTGTWETRASAVILYTYQWYLDGAVIPGETAATYDVVGGDSGGDVSCKVTAQDTVRGNRTTVTAAAVTIA
jgi:hypothetical protein